MSSTTSQAHSTSRVFKILTIVGVALAICLMITSGLLGYGTYAASNKATQTRADTESLHAQKKTTETETATVRTQVTAAKNSSAATTWCDGLTSDQSDITMLDNKSLELKNKSQSELDAIAAQCPAKKAFIEAFRDAPSNLFLGKVTDCTSTGNGLIMSGSLTLNGDSLTSVGDLQVTLNLFVTASTPTSSDKPLGTTTLTISGGSGTFSQTLPDPGISSGHCNAVATNVWPVGL